MSDIIVRLFRGYAILFRSFLSFVIGVVMLGVASVAVTLPIWLIADRFPRFYSVGVVVFLLIGLVSLFVVRKIRRDGPSAAIMGLLVSLGLTSLTVIALVNGTPLILLSWVVVVTLLLAYRLA